MSKPFSISDLASSLVERTRAQTTKIASAPVAAPSGEHPLSLALKQAAVALRAQPAPGVSMEAVLKFANAPMQPGTGAQSPAAGNGSGASAPKLPGLQTSNLGVVAGGGGMGETQKEASNELSFGLRKLAGDLRQEGARLVHEEQVKAAHVLNASIGLAHLRKQAGIADMAARGMGTMLAHPTATGAAVGAAGGAAVGAASAGEGNRLKGALGGAAAGGLAGGAMGRMGAGGIMGQNVAAGQLAKVGPRLTPSQAIGGLTAGKTLGMGAAALGAGAAAGAAGGYGAGNI